MKKKMDHVDCPYCGQGHEVPLDTDMVECTHCGYEIRMGEKVLPLSNNPLAP